MNSSYEDPELVTKYKRPKQIDNPSSEWLNKMIWDVFESVPSHDETQPTKGVMERFVPTLSQAIQAELAKAEKRGELKQAKNILELTKSLWYKNAPIANVQYISETTLATTNQICLTQIAHLESELLKMEGE